MEDNHSQSECKEEEQQFAGREKILKMQPNEPVTDGGFWLWLFSEVEHLKARVLVSALVRGATQPVHRLTCRD